MLNSAFRLNRGSQFPGIAAFLLAAALPAGAQEPFSISREDVVTIRAETAWEDIQPGIVHFSGGFEMQVRDWRLIAERATVHGPLDDPETVDLAGSPARLDLSRAEAAGEEDVEAAARRIVYQRDRKLVVLEGDARVSQGESVLRSSRIEYEPDTDRLRASGESGVRIDLPAME